MPPHGFVRQEMLYEMRELRLKSEARAQKLHKALEMALLFIEDDTCRHNEEKLSLLILIRAALKEAK